MLTEYDFEYLEHLFIQVENGVLPVETALESFRVYYMEEHGMDDGTYGLA